MASRKSDLYRASKEIADAIRDTKNPKPSVRRVEAGKHLMTLANLAAGALIFGQGFSGFPFNMQVAAIGSATVISLYLLALFLMQGGGRQ